jgi:hypothetical protein
MFFSLLLPIALHRNVQANPVQLAATVHSVLLKNLIKPDIWRCEVNMPGFAAESSLGPAVGTYIGKSAHFWSSGSFAASITSISPQQLSAFGTSAGRGCFGSLQQCIADHCFLDVDITPRQRILCIRACSQPTVCGSCVCDAGTGICERECRRSFVSSSGGFADVYCTGPCSP